MPDQRNSLMNRLGSQHALHNLGFQVSDRSAVAHSFCEQCGALDWWKGCRVAVVRPAKNVLHM